MSATSYARDLRYIKRFFLSSFKLQPTKLEENELDDAISVFRNHCEPHPLSIPMSNMDGTYVGPSPIVNTLGVSASQENNATNEPPTTIKLERVPANSSEYIGVSNVCPC